jgi:predicted GIY-YIG superfamily endonuclease
MRLWSIHPCYLDSQGLVALWREALLAQKVLKGETYGYRNHPQLIRFKDCSNPVAAIAAYLDSVYEEAVRRGYNFDKSKIAKRRMRSLMPVTSGQLDYEFNHLKKKLKHRDPLLLNRLRSVARPKPHSLFCVANGAVEKWETGTERGSSKKTGRPPGSWCLYMLKCSDGSLYTGITNDLARRLEQHNAGKASRYTRSRKPVKLIYQEPCRGRSRALKKEYALKSLTRKEKEDYIRDHD